MVHGQARGTRGELREVQMIVTIDGPAGAGKSSMARRLANKLGFRFLDTGAMYRAVALAAVESGLDWDEPEALVTLAATLELQVNESRVTIGGRDVTRVGEWSGECVGARWLDGSVEAAPGARFRGRNRSGWARWGRICEIDEAEPYALVWRTVPSGPYLDSVRWRLELAPADGGTRITQCYEAIRAPSALVVLFAYLVPSHRDRTAELVEDLQRLGAVAAG